METKGPKEAERSLSNPGENIFLVVFLLGLAILFPEALQLEGIFQGEWAGPGSLAQLMLVVLAALAGGLLVAAFRQAPSSLQSTIKYLFSRDAVLLLVTVIAYTVALVPLGFVVATLGFLIASMYFLEPVNLVRKIVLSVATVGVIYAVFAMLFEVVMP